MTLHEPRVVFEFSDQYHIRTERGLVKRGGLRRHEISVEDGRAPSPLTPSLNVIWPPRLTGVLMIDVCELGARYVRVKHGDREYWDTEDNVRYEDDDLASLARLFLARDPGGEGVAWPAQARSLYDPERDVWEGAVFDLNVSIFPEAPEEDEFSPTGQLWLKAVPLVKPRDAPGFGEEDEHRYEGDAFELGTYSRFHLENDRRDVPLLDSVELKDFEHEGAHLSVAAGVPLRKPVDFYVAKYDLASGRRNEPIELQDRHVGAFHVVWMCRGDDLFLDAYTELVYKATNELPRYVEEHRVSVEYARRRRYALESLQGKRPRAPDAIAPLNDEGERRWIADIEFESSDPQDYVRRTPTQGRVGRPVHAYSFYWLLPTDFFEKGSATVRPLDPWGSVARLDRSTTDRTQRVVFRPHPLTGDTYLSDLKQVLWHLHLCQAWQEEAQAFWEEHRDEIEAYTHIVQPIVRELDEMEWPTKGIAGGTTHATFSERESRQGVETRRNLKLLRRMTQRQSHHQDRAFEVFKRLRFHHVFENRKDDGAESGSDVYLDRGIRVGWESHVEQAAGRTVRVEAKSYTYDAALKAMIVGSLAGNYPLRARGDPSGRANDAARRRRIREFQEYLAPLMREMVKPLLEGEEGEAPTFLDTKSGLLHGTWKTLGRGGFSMFLYGTDGDRGLLADLLEVEGERMVLFDDEDGTPLEIDSRRLEQRATRVKAAWRERLAHDLDEGAVAGMQLFVGYLQVGLQVYWSARREGSRRGALERAYDWSTVAVASLELPLQTAERLSPGRFHVVDAAGQQRLTGLGKGLQFTGRVGGALGILQSFRDVFEVLLEARLPGAELDGAELGFALAYLAAAVVGLVFPVLGVALGLLVAMIQGIYSQFTISDMEKMMYWYCRTPWGDATHYDGSGELGFQSGAQRQELLKEALEAFNGFLREVYEDLDHDTQMAIRAFYQQYADIAGKYVGLPLVERYRPDPPFLAILVDTRPPEQREDRPSPLGGPPPL